jgi:hypothetical protein
MSLFTDGQSYERLMGRWSRAAGAAFLDWLSLPKGLNWLDVGCGTGAFTELVISSFCRRLRGEASKPRASTRLRSSPASPTIAASCAFGLRDSAQASRIRC